MDYPNKDQRWVFHDKTEAQETAPGVVRRVLAYCDNVMCVENTFETGIILQNGFSDRLGYGKAWCYPCAYEADHKLYIIYTVYLENEKRGAALSVVPLI